MLGRRLKNSLFLSLVCLVLAACGGKDKETDSAPDLDIPAILNWQESTNFSYTIAATGSEPLTYLLLHSADSSRFSLDPTTGVLSTGVFDYENPDDADGDRLYELKVIVQDSKSRSSTQEFVIRVTNLDEYSAEVAFPAAGAKLGGFETQFHIRGYLVNEGARVATPPQGVEVLVNDQVASFINNSGDWALEVPVQAGVINPVTIKLMQEGQEIYSMGYSLDNSFIGHAGASISKGDGSVLSIAVGEEAILESIDGAPAQPLVSIADVSVLGCLSFSNLHYANNENGLLVTCVDENDRENVFLHTMGTGNNRLLFSDLPRQSARKFEWIGDEYLLFSLNTNNFNLLHLESGEVKTIELLENPDLNFELGYFLNGTTLYVYAFEQGVQDWYSVDLQQAIDSTEPMVELTAQANGLFSNYSGQVAVAGDQAYFVHGNFIEVLDIPGAYYYQLDLSPSSYIDELFTGLGTPTIVHTNASFMVLRAANSSRLFSVDLSSGLITKFDNPAALPTMAGWDFSISPDNNEIVTFHHYTHEFVHASLEDFSVLLERDLTDVVWDTTVSHGKIDFDWSNNILYRHRIISWGGTEPNSDPLVLAYNVDGNYEQPVIDANVLYSLLGDDAAFYRIGETILTDNPNILWFSWIALNAAGGAVEGVAEFNLQTQLATPIYQMVNDPSIQADDPYLSPWSSALNGVVLTEWNDGYVATLDAKGVYTELLPSLSPYLMTSSADVDNDKNLLYYNGYLSNGNPDYPNPDYTTMEINEIDLNTNAQRLVASNARGNGVNFTGSEFQLDEKRKVLVGSYGGYLLLIDTYSGDRVLKALQ